MGHFAKRNTKFGGGNSELRSVTEILDKKFMKMYFAGSIRGGREKAKDYQKIIEVLSGYGTVLTEHVGNSELTVMGENRLNEKHIYERDMAWLKLADVFVVDVSLPSLGVGYEIATAEKLGKKILCLYQVQKNASLSAMISGNQKLTVKYYKSIKDVELILKEFFA